MCRHFFQKLYVTGSKILPCDANQTKKQLNFSKATVLCKFALLPKLAIVMVNNSSDKVNKQKGNLRFKDNHVKREKLAMKQQEDEIKRGRKFINFFENAQKKQSKSLKFNKNDCEKKL